MASRNGNARIGRLCQTRLLHVLTLALATVGAMLPHRAVAQVQLEGATETGMLVGVGLPELTARPRVGGTLTVWWRQQQSLNLGLQGAVALSILPYGRADGEPLFGRRAEAFETTYLHNDLTVMPRLAFTPRLVLSPYASLLGLLGVTFFVSSEFGRFSLIPFPTAGLGVEFKRSPASTFKLRIDVEYIAMDSEGQTRGVFLPTVAVAWK